MATSKGMSTLAKERVAAEERMRIAYLLQPDSDAEADDWSDAEPWDPAQPELWLIPLKSK
jgi:hypothetical protein